MTLSSADVTFQARAFLSWSERAGLPRLTAWRTWTSSKDLELDDQAAIEKEVRRLRVVAAVEAFVVEGERA